MRRGGGWFRLLFLVSILALLTTGVALGAPEHVTDNAGELSESQVTALTNGLAKRAIPYYVRIVQRGGTQQAMAQSAHDWWNLEDLPVNSVLITVAMRDRLVDFRAEVDGPVDQAIIAQTGLGFGGHIDELLEAFRGPAGRGDWAGAILAVADVVDRLAPSLSAAPGVETPGAGTPAPESNPPVTPGSNVPESVTPSAPAPEPTPTPTPTRPVTPPPVESTYRPPLPTQPTPTPAKPISPLIPVGVAGLGALTWWSIAAFRYRRQRRAGLQRRDAYAGNLLALQDELPLLRQYEGAETRALCDQTSAAIDAALSKHLEGEEGRQAAESVARFGRMIKARRNMLAATEAYEAAAMLQEAAAESWRPAAEALRRWDDSLAQAQATRTTAHGTLQATQVATGWPLGALGERLTKLAEELQRLIQLRQSDPVQAYLALLALQTELEALQTDLKRVEPLGAALQQLQPRAAQLTERRRSLENAHSLRWVEGDPARPIQAALNEREQGLGALREGKVSSGEAALTTATQLLTEAEHLLDRYQSAIQALPGLEKQVGEQTATLSPLLAEAARLTSDLTERFDGADWRDVADLPEALTQYQSRGRQLFSALPGLRSTAVQQLLAAHDQAVAFLADWAPLAERLTQLRERPAELEATAGRAAEAQARLADLLASCEGVVVRESLRLTDSLASRAKSLQQRLHAIDAMATSRRRPVREWLTQAQQAAEQAGALLQDIKELARQAEMARTALVQIQGRMGSAGRLRRYDRGGWTGQMDASLRAAEQALALGLYHEVLQHAHRADQFHNALQQEFRRAQEAEESARRAQEAQQNSFHNNSHSTSGGGGSFSSSSSSSSNNHNTTGGGGSW